MNRLCVSRTLIALLGLTGLAGSMPLLADAVQCTAGELTRDIEVVYSDPGQAVPCEVIYRKPAEGTVETPWRAYNQGGYCEEKAAGLVAKLQAAGWNCDAPAVTAPEAEPAAPAPAETEGEAEEMLGDELPAESPESASPPAG